MRTTTYLKNGFNSALKCTLLLAVFFCAGNPLKAQTVLYFETFDSASTNSWSLNTTDNGGDPSNTNVWVINDDYEGGLGGLIINTPDEPAGVTGGPGETNYMHVTSGPTLGYYNANFLNPENGNVFANMNVSVNTTNYTGVTLTFWYLCNGPASCSAKYHGLLFYSLNGGTTWIQEGGDYDGVTQWKQATVTDPAFSGAATLSFAFEWYQGGNCNNAADPPWAIDDVKLTGTTSVTCPITITSEDSTQPSCKGGDGTITLAATGDPVLTYKISNGTVTDSNTTGIFTNLAAGTYTVSVTNDTCTKTGTSIVLTNAAGPKAPTVSSNSPLCAGDTLKLSAIDTGTTITYNWSGPAAFASTSATPTVANVTTANSGAYDVTVTSDGCTVTGSTPVTVNPGPTPPTLGPTTAVCAGTTLDLTASNITNATYSWTGPNSFSSGLQDPTIPTVPESDSGWYVCTATITGCVPAVDSIFIHIGPGAPTVTASNNGPICTGQTLQLTVDTISGATYNWSGPNGFSKTIYDPTIANVTSGDAGTYNVTVTSSCGNSLSSTTVSVVTSPVAPTLSSPAVCIGSPLIISSSVVPGASYAWTGPNGFNATAQNDTITNASPSDGGYYVLTASVAGCGSVTDSTLAIVNTSLPTPPINSNNPVCQGDTLTFATSNYPGANYSWTGPQGVISVNQSTFLPNMNNGKVGEYYLTVDSGGCTGKDSIDVTVSAIPITKIPSNSYCYGDSAVLNAGSGFASYQWSNGSTDSVIEVKAFNTVVHDTLILSNGTGCSATYTATSVFLPKPDTTTFTQIGLDTLVSSWNNALYYQWFFNGDSIPNGIHDTLVISVPGNYSIVVTDSNGCSSSSQVVNVTTGINQLPSLTGSISIYPNPATGMFNIHCSGVFDQNIRMTLYDVIGQKVIDNIYHISNGQNIPVSIATLASGVYMVRIEAANQSFTRKLVIQ